jgi:hypothetical protein
MAEVKRAEVREEGFVDLRRRQVGASKRKIHLASCAVRNRLNLDG